MDILQDDALTPVADHLRKAFRTAIGFTAASRADVEEIMRQKTDLRLPIQMILSWHAG